MSSRGRDNWSSRSERVIFISVLGCLWRLEGARGDQSVNGIMKRS
jgi:hypothetical protein